MFRTPSASFSTARLCGTAAGALPIRTALDYARQIADALAAAHGRGIVHRDLKTENVIVTREGRTKILDFGIARRLPEAGSPEAPTLSERTEPGTILGTVGCMCPEQVRGADADARSDIFSLGVVLLEMLSGRKPFHRDTAAETMVAILHEEPTELADPARPLAPILVRMIRRCLEKSSEKCFQSARDLALDLEVLAAEPRATTPAPKTSLLPSIAVLPLRDMSPARDQDYFCEGMAEELLNALLAPVYGALERETDRLATMHRGLECARRHLALHPDDTRALYLGAGALVGIGNRSEGLEWAQRATERDPEDSSILYNVACVYALAGEKETVIETLEKALCGGWGNLAWIKQDTDLDPLHDHPRWKELVGD